MSSDPLLTEADLARELQVRSNYLAKLRVRGDGPPYIKLAGKVRYRRSALPGLAPGQGAPLYFGAAADLTSSGHLVVCLSRCAPSGVAPRSRGRRGGTGANCPRNRGPNRGGLAVMGRLEVEALVARARRCLAGGYPPVPILRPDAPAFVERDGRPVKQSPGKQPHGLLWSRKEQEVYGATPAKVARWAGLPDIADYPGVGIACGAVAAVDVDIYEPALAEAGEALAVEHFGPTSLRRVGQAPKRLLVYRVQGDAPLSKAQTPELFRGSLDGPKAKVEVLGRGQQFVAYGVHPATGLPFAWGGATPETTPAAGLPAVTQERVEAFVADAERLLRAAGYRTKAEIQARGESPPSPGPLPRPAAARPANGHGDASPFKAVNDAALARPEAWVPGLFPRARRDARGVWRVTSDELGRGLEEDISIAPPGAASRAGIVDFGEHDQGDPRQGKRTPIDLVLEHGGAPDAKRAAEWLAGRLGMTLETGRRRASGRTAGDAGADREAGPGPGPGPGPAPGADPEGEGADSPEVRARVELADERWNAVTDQCADLLQDAVYLRGTIPVMPLRAAEADGEAAADRDGPAVDVRGVRHRPGGLLFVEASPARVARRLNERALFWRYTRCEKDWTPTRCPKELAAEIVDTAAFLDLRPCAGIVHVPLLVRGRLVAEPGYHAPTGLILDLRGPRLDVPAAPGREAAERALERLLRPFRGYLDSGAVQRPAAAAAALTAALRPSLPTAPAIAVDGNNPAVGKGKLARVLGAINTGGAPAIVTEGHSPEETEKRITTAVVQGAPAILLDNMQRAVASSTLESMLTEPVADIRVFGRLGSQRVACRSLVLMTFNNVSLRRDMLRRTLPVRIAVPDEKPELRAFDFEPVAEAMADRAELLAAAFTVALAWLRVRDLPENKAFRRPLGSFEEWADLVAGAVAWLTGKNPVDLIEERGEQDPGATDERRVIESLAERYANQKWAAKAAARDLDRDLWAAVMKMKGEQPEAGAVGRWLRARKDRVFGNLTLTNEVDRKGVAEWCLVPAPGMPGIAGDKRLPQAGSGEGEGTR